MASVVRISLNRVENLVKGFGKDRKNISVTAPYGEWYGTAIDMVEESLDRRIARLERLIKNEAGRPRRKESKLAPIEELTAFERAWKLVRVCREMAEKLPSGYKVQNIAHITYLDYEDDIKRLNKNLWETYTRFLDLNCSNEKLKYDDWSSLGIPKDELYPGPLYTTPELKLDTKNYHAKEFD